ncbi:hypothetical protein SUGI_0322560 [Cryptomeria japonica]|uniref:uncharacterized protein LOC131874416 n=1 Tax=Cryptomeria japonica TaxID=3369 RepID=UPI002408C80B|nr:uncharacterized protein LOC131874416 [Cryptomeria japonica]GLJ18237.1 hypothetical protein SUGI_0322560 [Cryptomeria japonica]
MTELALQNPLDVDGGSGEFTGKVKGRRYKEKGEIVVDLMEEMEEDRQFWEEQAVIARIIGLNWSRKNIISCVEDNWGDQIVIKFIPKGFFVVLFEKRSERDRILNQENWFADKHAVYLQPWTPNFDPIPLAVYSCPIWICLYNLPIEYWGEVFLEKIGKMLGTVLEIDVDDEEDLCKYVRLRIAAVRRIPEHITLHTSKGAWSQQIEVEKEIRHCPRCGSKFHGVEDCRMFIRKARTPFRRPIQNWRRKLEQPSKTVSVSVEKIQETKSPPQQQKKGSSSPLKVEDDLYSEIRNVAINRCPDDGGETPRQEEFETKEGGEDPLTPRINNSCKGLSDTEFEFDKDFEEEMFQEDALENVDPRCIS